MPVTSSPSARVRPAGEWLRDAEADRLAWPPTRRGAPVWRSFWRIRFAGPVFRFGQNPVFGVCFGLEVSDMRVRTISRLYGDAPTAVFYHFGFKIGDRLCLCGNS